MQEKFLEIGTNKDHVHFGCSQADVQRYEVNADDQGFDGQGGFRMRLQVKNQLEDGEFWPTGHFVSTVGKYGDEAMIGEYAKNQGGDYKMLHSAHQLSLF